ncbi:MAG: hypothetical protein OQK01_03550 [Xanthomonadales bacterium]|jgi:hypothetical protein|nr:hypothetical protein [Xanthomonadales bacterium]
MEEALISRVWIAKVLPVLTLAWMLLMPIRGLAAFDFSSLEPLTPGEQYRQLSLLSLMAGGVDPALLELLQPVVQARTERRAAGDPGMELALDDYVKPLARIIDQDILLAGAAQLFQFARENGPEIQARMTRIARANPILISMVDVNEIAADAIIIRNAIADGIEYSAVIDDPSAPAQVRALREQTVYLRNMMEFNQFQQELALLTEEAIIDLGGRLDAYQRMFNDEVDPELIKRRVESSQIMNQQTESRFEEQAMQNNSELLMMLILMESQIH